MTSTPTTPPSDKGTFVREMFARIAPRYDTANRVLTAGMDESWRKRAIAITRAAQRRHDSRPLLRHRRRRLSSSADRSDARRHRNRFLRADARRRARARAQRGARHGRAFVEGDVMALPFADARSTARRWDSAAQRRRHRHASCAEVRRVLKPGCALRQPRRQQSAEHNLQTRLRPVFLSASSRWSAAFVGGSKQAYAYLPNSLTHHPNADATARAIRRMPDSSIADTCG